MKKIKKIVYLSAVAGSLGLLSGQDVWAATANVTNHANFYEAKEYPIKKNTGFSFDLSDPSLDIYIDGVKTPLSSFAASNTGLKATQSFVVDKVPYKGKLVTVTTTFSSPVDIFIKEIQGGTYPVFATVDSEDLEVDITQKFTESGTTTPIAVSGYIGLDDIDARAAGAVKTGEFDKVIAPATTKITYEDVNGYTYFKDETGPVTGADSPDYNVVLEYSNKTQLDYHMSLVVPEGLTGSGIGLGYAVYDSIDTDGDGLSDVKETTETHTDPNNPDTDGDGLPDGEEVNTYHTDPLNPDTDGDGLPDGEEVNTYKTDPTKADTDGDGIPDGKEVNETKTDPLNPDTDGDGLSDGQEVNDYKTDPLNPDTDGDGLSDGQEVNETKTDPNKADTDGDGLSDGQEVNETKTDPNKADTDGDGLSDGQEVNETKTDPNKADTDGDGLSDGQEVNETKTDPNKADTDGDGISDGDEVKNGTDPLDPNDPGSSDPAQTSKGDPADPVKSAAALPKTGENSNVFLSMFGALLAACAAFLGKRKYEKE